MASSLALALDALRELAARRASSLPGLKLVVLFGSVAKGTARSESDADLGVLGGDSWKSLELGSALAALLGREPHVVDLAHAPEVLRFEVARAGIPLYEAEPFVWARFQAEAALGYYDLQPMIALCAEGVRRRLTNEAKP